MQRIYYILFFFIISSNLFSQTLFNTDFYDLEFISNDIENDKIKKISQIKFLSINKILNNILILNDYNNIKEDLSEDIVNTFIKNIIVDNEKIINNRYSSNIKINFNKKKIITYIRDRKIPYIEFYPKNFLLIIYEKDNISKNLFSKNNSYYKYLLKNIKEDNIYQIPNLDINDRFLLNYDDIEIINKNKISNFANKYSNLNTVIVISDKKNDSINYEIYLLLSDNLIKIDDLLLNERNYEKFFHSLRKKIINQWKIYNAIQNIEINKLNCNIRYYNLLELNKIKSYIGEISLIKNISLKKISFKLNEYDIFFYGNIDILYDLFHLSRINLSIDNNVCNIYLK